MHKHLSRVAARFEAIGPRTTVFFGSLLLSLIAVPKGTINRDGMFYVEIARDFLEGGLAAAYATFHWPFLAILMAVVSQITGLGLEASGLLLNGLFLAGACTLLVACASRMFPEAVWPIALALLALPGFNEYRNELLREYGCWFFVMLSFWLAMRWSDAPRWPLALAIQLSLLVATLFRTEALAFFPALILWQLFEAPPGERWRRLVMIGGLPVIGLATLLALYASGQLGSGRLARDLSRFSLERFDAKALAMAPAFIDYARDQARTVLFFGSLAIVPVKFIVKMGIFILPLLYAFSGQTLRTLLGRSRLFAWAFLVHALVLCVFVLDLQFLSGRYLGLLLAFATPLTGYGFWLLMRRFPAWKTPMVLLALLVMIGNVVSLSPNKFHYVEAGNWLSQNATESERVYIESARAAYYAGWRYAGTVPDHARLRKGLSEGAFDLIVLEVSQKKESDIEKWLHELKIEQIAVFDSKKGKSVIIARPMSGIGQGKRANTPAIREKTSDRE